MQRGDQIPFIGFTGNRSEEVAIKALNTITPVSPQIANYEYMPEEFGGISQRG